MSEKPRAVSSHDIALDKEYAQWIHDIKQRFHNAQIKSAVNYRHPKGLQLPD